MEIQLYIRGMLADIGDKKEFVRNFKHTLQFSDLTNPTNVVTDYSYSINLPGTDNNKRIFGYVDSLGTDLTTFNPAVPYEFILNVDGNLWLHGDVQLTKATVQKGATQFTCSFYTVEHELLVRLGNTPLNKVSTLQDSSAFSHYLDREAMGEFWGRSHQFADVIRYVPTRAGFYADFQNDKVMTPKYNASEPPQVTGMKTVDIGTDIDEYASREYRIEYQRPAVSVHFLMEGISNDSGIKIDSSLMASPYVNDGWMLCPQFNVEAENIKVEGTFPSSDHTVNKPGSGYGGTGWNVYGMSQQTAYESTIFNGSTISPDAYSTQVTVEFVMKLTCDMDFSSLGYDGPKKAYMRYGGADSGVELELELAGTGGQAPLPPNEGTKTIYMLKTSGASEAPYWFDPGPVNPTDHVRHWTYHCTATDAKYPGWSDNTLVPCRFTWSFTPGTQMNLHYLLNMFLDKVSFSWGDRPSPTSAEYTTVFHPNSVKFEVMPITVLNSGDLSKLQTDGWNCRTLTYEAGTTSWSPLYINMNTIMSSEAMSQRDFLGDFTKMTGCVWDVSHGEVVIENRNKYFQNYQILDWSDKLDRSQGMEITPLTFDKRVYTLGYKAGDSFLENQFKDSVGKEYGMQYVNTGYGFNSDTENLYTDFAYNTVMSKGQRITYSLDTSNNIAMREENPYEIPMIEKKDHNAPNEGHRYVFDCGYTTLGGKEMVCITQDSSWMSNSVVGGRCWYDLEKYGETGAIGNNIAIASKMPFYGTRKGMATFDWAKPEISYSKETDATYPEGISLYSRFWGNYLEELYSAQNRVITANFWLDTMDLLTFSFRNFVVIDNHLFHPNRIIDYDISGESLTKVELVEVHNIDAWVNGQNWDFIVNRSSTVYDYDSSNMIEYPEIEDEPQEEE